jgi:hypothetical protein
MDGSGAGSASEIVEVRFETADPEYPFVGVTQTADRRVERFEKLEAEMLKQRYRLGFYDIDE